jgi:hypothetical protein
MLNPAVYRSSGGLIIVAVPGENLLAENDDEISDTDS